MAHGDPGLTIGKINLSGTSDNAWKTVGDLAASKVADSTVARVAEAIGPADIRDECQRVAINIVRRIDETSEFVSGASISSAGAEALHELTRTLDSLVDIIRRS